MTEKTLTQTRGKCFDDYCDVASRHGVEYASWLFNCDANQHHSACKYNCKEVYLNEM